MDTRQWFDEGTYSDLTVKLSNGTEIKVQKIIVCRANEYFRKLCGPDSHFAESKQTTIELKDDDPTALKNVLRYIYKLPVAPDPDCENKWRVWLDLHMTADKYLEPELSRAAEKDFRQAALESTDSDTIFDIIEAIDNEMAHDESLVDFGNKLRKDNIGILLKNDRFRAQLDRGGKEALWQQLDELIFAADLVKRRYHLCLQHHDDVFQQPSEGVDEESTGPCFACQVSAHDGFRYYNDVYGSSAQYQERAAFLPK